MEILEEFFGGLTPSELDELAPAGFDAKAPRGAVKRVEKMALERAGFKAKKRARLKPLMIAAAAVVASAATLFTVNAATDGNLVKFLFKGNEYEGDTYDYVDHNGFRHIGFEVKVPVFEDNYAIIYDVDAPQGENVRVITEESDPELMAKIKAYAAARFNSNVNYKDFGIVLKDSELCEYSVGYMDEEHAHNQQGSFGGEFMRTGAAAGKPSGGNCGETDGTFYEWDFENEKYYEMKTIRQSIYYYVGN